MALNEYECQIFTWERMCTKFPDICLTVLIQAYIYYKSLTFLLALLEFEVCYITTPEVLMVYSSGEKIFFGKGQIIF